MVQKSSHKKLDVLPVTLSGLAFACYVYAGMSKADKPYDEFRQATDPMPDIEKSEHREKLLRWLNQWGCRQFAKDNHPRASNEIRAWYEECRRQLPPREITLLDISDADLSKVSIAYENLAERIASERKSDKGKIVVKIGPTGAAKILFAIRPQSLMPWDESIRKEFGLGDKADSYIAFLKQVKTGLEELDQVCQRHGHELSELPNLFKRPGSSLVKLIDEYFWVTITNECKAPTNQDLEQWIEWTNWI